MSIQGKTKKPGDFEQISDKTTATPHGLLLKFK